MQKQEPITIINVDEVPHAVSDMSDNVKRLVSIYNDWRGDEETAKSELLKTQAGMRDLSREIVMTIKQEKQAKAQQDQAVADANANAKAANEEVVTPAKLEAAANEIGDANVASIEAPAKKAPVKRKAATSAKKKAAK